MLILWPSAARQLIHRKARYTNSLPDNDVVLRRQIDGFWYFPIIRTTMQCTRLNHFVKVVCANLQVSIVLSWRIDLLLAKTSPTRNTNIDTQQQQSFVSENLAQAA